MNKQLLTVTHPNLVKEWDKEKNGDLTPDKFKQPEVKKEVNAIR